LKKNVSKKVFLHFVNSTTLQKNVFFSFCKLEKRLTKMISFCKFEKCFKNVCFHFINLRNASKTCFHAVNLKKRLKNVLFFILQTLETLTCFSFCKLENASKKLFHVVNFKNKSNTCLFILQTWKHFRNGFWKNRFCGGGILLESVVFFENL